jgi:methylated-DNA-protein-cysteine methyltransferase-like protein
MMAGSGLPYDPRVFFPQVWEVVRRVPVGQVTTYGWVAALVPCPAGVAETTFLAFGPRWVGTAMAACPEGVPWQRVVNSEGRISPRSGAENQRLLLQSEGVQFDAKGRIDLKRFGWRGGEDSSSSAHQESLF